MSNAVAIIPARSGSRRIPMKNIKMFHGKPIIAYSIEAAKESGLFESVWVSTEDREIAVVAMDAGAKWYPRPVELADDAIGTQAVMADALKTCRVSYEAPIPDYACCIYPCAPMMTSQDLRDGMLWRYRFGGYAYVPGWYYWGRTAFFLNGEPLLQEHEVKPLPENWIDINTPEDFAQAEKMYSALHR